MNMSNVALTKGSIAFRRRSASGAVSPFRAFRSRLFIASPCSHLALLLRLRFKAFWPNWPAKPPPYYIRALLNAEVTVIVGKIKKSAIINFSVLKIAKKLQNDILGRVPRTPALGPEI
jgi:hypothetical protein